jgi:transcriptional regulator with XRE-family HTH domain
VKQFKQMSKIDTHKLSQMIKSKRGDRGLRETCSEIGASPSTLSRIEQGNLPDIETYIKICKWLEVSTDFFTESAEDSSEKKVVAHLRADKALPKETSEALIKMIKLAYKAHYQP